jgi:OmpA-OmpF porin, OOP family
MERKKIVLNLVVLFLTTSMSSFGTSGEKAKAEGMIISRSSDTLLVKNPEGKVTVVLLDDGSKTIDRTGVFGLGETPYSNAVLIPGLKVDVSGVSGDQGSVVAKTIIVDGDDLEAAQMIESGLHPTAQQVAANVRAVESHQQKLGEHETQLAAQKENIETNQRNIATNMKDIEDHTERFMRLADYDVKANATVKFSVGSSSISPEDEEQLKKLAQTAASIKGYIVEVVGYADSTGNAAMNTQLSENRAKAVVTYLVQQGGVPIRHIVAPGAMGEYGATASNETKQGRAENRRVDVRILVNKGIAGS